MRTSIRNLITISIVLIWATGLIIIALLTAFNLIDTTSGLNILEKFNSSTSGFVGIIVGYYFGCKGEE